MARSAISGNRNSISRDARKAFQIEGLKEIQDKLGNVIDAVTGKQVKDVYYTGGTILRDQAQANAPYDPGRKKGTHLRDAIFVSRGRESEPNVLVGVRYNPAGAPHGHIIEYGAENHQAQPFMRPAMASKGQQIGDTIKGGLLKVIEKAVK